MVDPETERDYIRKLISSQQDIDVYVGVHRNVVKQAKKAGINTKKILESIKARKLNLPEVIQDVKDYIRYCALQNMPVRQDDIFPAPSEEEVASEQRSEDDLAWDAGQQGYSAGLAGRKVDECPHVPGSANDAEWRRQWQRGQEHLVKKSLGGPPPAVEASDRRQRGANGTRSKVVPEAARRRAGGLQANTPADVHAAVAEDDREEAG
jgi:ribosome modulation factor